MTIKLFVGGVLLVAGWLLSRREELHQWPCIVRGGHNDLLSISNGHLRLRCADCGRMTSGWNGLGSTETSRPLTE